MTGEDMGKKKILVVDDEAELVELVKTRLEANGYAVATAHDGIEGLSKAQRERPDLIVLDIGMAQMDGYTMLQKIREDEKMKGIPVIMLTAYGKMKDLFEVEGVSDYIVKPFDPQDFLSRVARVLKEGS
jgi:two-component system, OmpR family, alkaline phosphatase synthesis response regulator PhoP